MSSPASWGWVLRHSRSGPGQCIHLGLGRPFVPRDDAARVAHTPARGRRHPGDVGHHGLGEPFGDKGRRLLFFRAPDLADQHHGLGVRVRLEGGQAVDKSRARDGVAADADAGGDADAHLLQLVERLISQCATAADDADRTAGQSDLARSDADVAFTGTDYPRAVGPDETDRRVHLAQFAVHLGFVLGRDALGYANDQFDAGRGRLEHRPRRHLGRDSHKAGVGPGCLPGLGGGGEHGYTFDVLPALGRVDARHHLGPVVPVAQPVETGLPTGQTVDDHLGGLIDENAHFSPPASSTARRAASIMLGELITISDSTVRRISRP